MSETAPAGNGEITRMGRLGKDDCASAEAATNPRVIATVNNVATTLLAPNMRSDLRVVLRYLPFAGAGCHFRQLARPFPMIHSRSALDRKWNSSVNCVTT